MPLKEGLTVITGVSGAGKSILTESILALFGAKELNEGAIELTLDIDIAHDDIDSDELLIIKANKKDKVRYFINQKAYPKKGIRDIFAPYLSHIGQKDRSDMDAKNILSVLDSFIAQKLPQHAQTLQLHKELFSSEETLGRELKKLEEEEKKIEELIEFAEFEINKIERINPKVGEYEDLMNQKRLLSQKEKITKALNDASEIFEMQGSVSRALEVLEEDDSFFNDAMNTLHALFEGKSYELENLDDLDIEGILNRLEELSGLINRYGGIEDVLLYKEKKITELAGYKNISISKDNIQKELEETRSKRAKVTNELTHNRTKYASTLEKAIDSELKKLYLEGFALELHKKGLDESGEDGVIFRLKNSSLENVSSGEFNRIRLAFLSVKADIFMSKKSGILIVDEIDANLSGEESEAIALLLKKLSSTYQVISISHQPHLPSIADTHLLVYKEGDISGARILSKEQSVNEIARMISGSEITKEALEFAKKRVYGKQ